MIVDSSALVAIVRVEPDARDLLERLRQHNRRCLSAASYLETSIVIDGNRDALASARIDLFLEDFRVEIVAVTAEHARIARQAYRDFGKGSGHPARLNFGDCFAYALAKGTGEPLLYKGGDFGLTDIAAA